MAAPSVIVTDDVGFFKRIQGLPENPGVVSRWGEAQPGEGVVKCTPAVKSGDDQVFAVARESGTVDIWECKGGRKAISFPHREGTKVSPVRHSRKPLSACAALDWVNNSNSQDFPPLLSVSRDGLVCIRHLSRDPAAPSQEASNGAAELTMRQTLASSFDLLSSNGGGGAQGISADEERLFVECAAVGPSGDSLAVGGKGELCVWDLEKKESSWRSKNPKPNSLGLVEQKWVTSLCHVIDTSDKLIAVGMRSGRIHLFDTSAQRRPVASWQAGESPVKALLPAGTAVAHESALVFGCGDGIMGLADVRKGQLLGRFKGGAGGSVKALTRHPTLPILASCGFDRHIRFHDLQTRELKGQVFLKQAGTGIVFFESELSRKEGEEKEEETNEVEASPEAAPPPEETRTRRKSQQAEHFKRKKRRS